MGRTSIRMASFTALQPQATHAGIPQPSPQHNVPDLPNASVLENPNVRDVKTHPSVARCRHDHSNLLRLEVPLAALTVPQLSPRKKNLERTILNSTWGPNTLPVRAPQTQATGKTRTEVQMRDFAEVCYPVRYICTTTRAY